MADGFSVTFANALCNVLGGVAPTTYASYWIQLHTGAPGSAGTSNISVGSTTRVNATTGTASNTSNVSTIPITNTPQWTNGGAVGEVLTDFSAWSLVTAGVFLFSGQLVASKTWSTTDVVQMASLLVGFPTAS
jgi:hypothetical protein